MTSKRAHISFEFFPPFTSKGQKSLLKVAKRLNTFNPEYFSVTYGAGGTTRERTYETVSSLCQFGYTTVPHLSWGAATESEILELLDRYAQLEIGRVVALRGDLPSGLGNKQNIRYAKDLVNLIQKNHPSWLVEVAAYPEVHPDSNNHTQDALYLKEKVDAGASGCITQYFYNTDSYFYFVDLCRSLGITVPIIPGIMPITNQAKLEDFSKKAGAEIPRWLTKRLNDYEPESEDLLQFGIEFVSRLCERLLAGGAPGFHFYTLNKAKSSESIAENIGFLENI